MPIASTTTCSISALLSVVPRLATWWSYKRRATEVERQSEAEDGRGRQATRPSEVPPRGWLDVLKRTRRGIRDTNASIVAAGVAFYAFLSLFTASI